MQKLVKHVLKVIACNFWQTSLICVSETTLIELNLLQKKIHCTFFRIYLHNSSLKSLQVSKFGKSEPYMRTGDANRWHIFKLRFNYETFWRLFPHIFCFGGAIFGFIRHALDREYTFLSRFIRTCQICY